MGPQRAVLFTVRTGDERIAPESLSCRKSLFVHHKISKKSATEPIPVVKPEIARETSSLFSARYGQTHNSFPVNRQNAIFVTGKKLGILAAV
jgi:hypothetical protein